MKQGLADTSAHRRRQVGLVAGLAVAALMLAVGPIADFSQHAWFVAALTILMATWWVTDAAPLPVTGLLPIAVLPVMGVGTPSEIAAPYASPIIFLFLCGLLIALAVQRWNLHRRIALLILRMAGQRPDHLVAGFMLGTALLSMWISNTATAAMMLPTGLAVLALVESQRPPEAVENQQRFNVALLLGIAFSANIGGMGTLIGTPPNALFAAFMAENHDIHIGFAQWMLVGVPVALLLLALSWWILTRWAFPLERTDIAGVADLIERKRKELGPLSDSERRVLGVLVLTALAWMLRPWLEETLGGVSLSDAGIAMTGAIALFLIPAAGRGNGPLLVWEATRELPWGVLVMVGGGLSLGTAMTSSGLSTELARYLTGLGVMPVWVIVAAVAAVAMLISHIASNTATTATMLPLVSGLALSLGQPPLLLAVAVAMAASCAFMLPVATPPNAIVFASERLRVPDMVRAGARISIVALAIVTLAVFVLAVPVLSP